MGIGKKRLHPSYEIFNSTSVGWVEAFDVLRINSAIPMPCYLSVTRSTDFFSR